MGRKLLALCTVALMLLCGCSKGVGHRTQVALPDSVRAAAEVQYQGLCLEGDLFYSSQSTTLTLRSPPSLRGLTLTLEGDSFTADYDDLSFSVDREVLTPISVLPLISSALGAVNGTEAMVTGDGALEATAQTSAGKVNVTFPDENFFPKSISVEEVSFQMHLLA